MVSTGYSQDQISFRQLSVKEGLSQNSIISITQDSTGYLWMATQDGLNKYDGRQFTVFPYNFVDITKQDYSNLGKVYTDRQGGVWILPLDRIPRRLDPISQTFTPIEGIRDASALYQDDHFNLWIGTYSNGLFVLENNTKAPRQVITEEHIKGTIFNVIQHPSGDLLLTSEAHLIKYNPISGKHSTIQPSLLPGDVITTNFSDIVFDSAGRQWTGTYGDGLYFKAADNSFYHRISELAFTDPLPSNLNILDLYADKRNRLWIATYGRGLFLVDFNQNKITNFNAKKQNPRAIHYNDILCILEDDSGTMWFGTDGAGVSFFDAYLEKFNSFTNYQTPENINIDVVRAIAVDQEKHVWIGTSGKGLSQYNPQSNSWQAFTTDDGSEFPIASNRIMSLLTDDYENLWIGTQENGLNIYVPDKGFEYYNSTSEIPLTAATVWAIFRDSKKRTWLGTREQGLILFDSKKGELKKYKSGTDSTNGLTSNNIRVIAQAEGDKLWLGTESQGVVLFDLGKETFKQYRHSSTMNSIASNNIKSLYAAPNNVLWIGTNGGGLNAFDIKSQKFYNYTVTNGLANNVIYGILPDEAGNLWLSSNKGISKFTAGESLEEAPSIINYNNYDGLATEFNTGAHFKDQKGNLYFGGLDGFYWFKPNEIQENTYLPQTVITGFEVSNQTFPMLADTRLEHDQNTLSFVFSSLQYSLPEKNQYQYRLVNYDNDWIQAGNNNFARYSFLPPGTYVFQVKSSNYDGLWNENPASFSLTIASPWYWTPFSKGLYSLLFLAAIYSIYYYLRWRWKVKTDMKIKEAETIRLQKLNDFKSKLYTDISHEFRTPLTLISGPVDAKLSSGILSDTDFNNFSMIKRNTNRLIALVDQLLHLAKLEKGKLKLNIAKGDLGLFLNVIAGSFEHKAAAKEISYKYNTSVEQLRNIWYDEDAIEKMVTNLISNAIKYCPHKGDIIFNAEKKEGSVLLSIKNTVEKLSESDLELIFTRFYQKDEYAEGAGIGLSLVKELVQLYDGEIHVAIKEKRFIEFRLSLPIDIELFQKNNFREDKKDNESQILPKVSGTDDPGSTVGSLKANEEELPIVLLVDDHLELREFLSAELGAKYQIFEAENGQIGIKTALEIVPDLIITDIRMPVCSGIKLCNELKSDERTSHIPIIVLTAGMEEEDELKGLQSGADDFITKPFKLRILEKRVENLIASRKALRGRYSQEVVLKARDIAITPTDELLLDRMQQILDSNLSDSEFNAAAFSRMVGMSRMQLHRKLLAFTGLSATAFIRSQRLKQAMDILKTSDATINEVAYSVGFNTPSYFIKCFKEAYNKTPAEFLQSVN